MARGKEQMIKTFCLRGSRLFSNRKNPLEFSKHFQYYMNAVKLRGLPYLIQEEEIVYFFRPYKVVTGSVKIGVTKDNSDTGFGAVCFWNKIDMDSAVKEKQGKVMKERFIELFKIPDISYEQFLSAQLDATPFGDQVELDDRKNSDYEVLIQNLPYKTTVKDLCIFFSSFSLDKSQIALIFHKQKFSGNAVIKFRSRLEALFAIDSFNLKTFNSSKIVLSLLNSEL